MIDHTHKFIYTVEGSDPSEDELYCDQKTTRELSGDATLQQIVIAFESHLRSCGYVFKGNLTIVEDDKDIFEPEDVIPSDEIMEPIEEQESLDNDTIKAIIT